MSLIVLVLGRFCTLIEHIAAAFTGFVLLTLFEK